MGKMEGEKTAGPGVNKVLAALGDVLAARFEVIMVANRCLRCGNEWLPNQTKRTTKCPNCQTKNWDKPTVKPETKATIKRISDHPAFVRPRTMGCAYCGGIDAHHPGCIYARRG